MPTSLAIAATVAAALSVVLAGCGGSSQVAGAQALPPELLPVLTAQARCTDGRLVQVRQHRYDFTGDAVGDALVAVRCDTGAGAPPSAVYAVAATADGAEVLDELLPAEQGEVVKDLGATGPTAVVTTFAYSPDAPRCCPDLEVVHRFRWDGTAFAPGTRQAAPLPTAAAG